MGKAVSVAKDIGKKTTYGTIYEKGREIISGGKGGAAIPALDTGELAKSRSEIAMDIARGEAQLGKEFTPGALGRLDVARTGDISQVIEGRRALLGGLSSQESQALRERGAQEIERGTQTALRQLRGLQGVRGQAGGAALGQQTQVLAAGQQAKAQAERDLLIQNIQERRAALGEFETSVTSAEQAEEARRLFNLQQQQRETFGRLSSGLGFAQLGVQERAAQRGVSTAATNVAAASSGGKL